MKLPLQTFSVRYIAQKKIKSRYHTVFLFFYHKSTSSDVDDNCNDNILQRILSKVYIEKKRIELLFKTDTKISDRNCTFMPSNKVLTIR